MPNGWSKLTDAERCGACKDQADGAPLIDSTPAPICEWQAHVSPLRHRLPRPWTPSVTPEGTPAIQLLAAEIQLLTAENKQNATTVPNDHAAPRA